MVLKNNILKIKLYKNDFKILKIFFKLNIIKNIKYYDKNNYIIYLNNKNNYKNIENLYKPSKLLYIKLKDIKKINRKKSNLFYISTNKGLINNFEAEKKNLGGIIIMKL